jgi:predicted short-subunit dehydrogenase-like oxidoreductase (DUF2520 family)
MVQYNISIAGAGRLATAICRQLYLAGHKINLIVSETEKNGLQLADSCGASWSCKLSFHNTTEVIIVAVPDSKLRMVLNNINCSSKTIVVHTAGSYGLEVFPDKIASRGVFYPLQTFTKGRTINFNELPFFLEPLTGEVSLIMKDIVESMGGKAYFIDNEQKKMLHLAAVYINNFTNHSITLGKDIAGKAGIPFSVYHHLIKETVEKILDSGPENSQTGPAIRNDMNTIEKHIELLSFSKELQTIYTDMTNSIITYYRKNSCNG